jgi:hypothetical protein
MEWTTLEFEQSSCGVLTRLKHCKTRKSRAFPSWTEVPPKQTRTNRLLYPFFGARAARTLCFLHEVFWDWILVQEARGVESKSNM